MMQALEIMVTMTAASLLTKNIHDESWIESFHYKKKYVFPDEYTSLVDSMFKNNPSISKIGPTNANDGYPALGLHYFYGTRERLSDAYVVFQRKEEQKNDKFVQYYVAWVGPLGFRTYQKAVDLIFAPKPGTVQVISIDTSSHLPSLMRLNRISHPPTPVQEDVLDMIASYYTEDTNFNVKLLLSGPRGTGKTTCAAQLKPYLEKRLLALGEKTTFRVFADFDPTVIGVNVNSLILQGTTKESPAIIVMNELDVILADVVSEESNHDPRLQHTRDKKSFNNMMDSIASTRYVIGVYTTEKSPAELLAVPEYRSLIRAGRVDLVAVMTQDNVMLLNDYFAPSLIA